MEEDTKHSNQLAILTSTSIQTKNSKAEMMGDMMGDISANTLLSKYVIEKLIANDTATTFKITHYVKIDYR
jgi:hypothetical protein